MSENVTYEFKESQPQCGARISHQFITSIMPPPILGLEGNGLHYAVERTWTILHQDEDFVCSSRCPMPGCIDEMDDIWMGFPAVHCTTTLVLVLCRRQRRLRVATWTGIGVGDRSPIRVRSGRLSELLRGPGPWMEERGTRGPERPGYGQSPNCYGAR